MEQCMMEKIQSVKPHQCERERWLQYHELTRSLFPMVKQGDMDEVCRAIARWLNL